MEVGVFVPIGNNGWLISETSPQYQPSFKLNADIVLSAERHSFDFALSMIKLHGFGGKTGFWDYNLESFTLMAGLAAITTKINIFASIPVLALPPAIAARMAVTVDSISNGRFGVNIVSGWQKSEYSQMGLWPEHHFRRRYEYCAEYVQVMRDLWTTGRSDLKGEFFTMEDCRLLPLPQTPIKIICAGQSDAGMAFAATYGDYNFILGVGVNTPGKVAPIVHRLAEATAKTGRNVGAFLLMMVIADETDAAAMAKWKLYNAGTDWEAIQWLIGSSKLDVNAKPGSSADHQSNPEGAINLNMGTLVGSYASVAAMLDELAAVEGVRGVLLTFDEFLSGVENFGSRIQPLMRSRSHITAVRSVHQ
jgi:pyrimidine oxygenase